jgi:hypothetical protein
MEESEMKASNKADSWCYTVSKTRARQKAKRATGKRHRREAKLALRKGE